MSPLVVLVILALWLPLSGCMGEGCECIEGAVQRKSTTEVVGQPESKTETATTGTELRHAIPTNKGTRTEMTRTEVEVKKPSDPAGWCTLSLTIPPGRNACAVCC